MIQLSAKAQDKVAAMNPQQRETFFARKFGGYRASHPGKPRSYYQRPNTPKQLRSQTRGINPGTV